MEAITHEEYVNALGIVQRYQEQEADEYVSLWGNNLNSRVVFSIIAYFWQEFQIKVDPFKIKRNDILNIDLSKMYAYRNFGRKSQLELSNFIFNLRKF